MGDIESLVNKGVTAMRRGIGFLWVTLTGIFLAVVGVIAYQAGWAAGAATQLPAGAAGAPYYYYGPHDGFGFFGFFGFLFVLFLFFVLFRLARFGRGWGYGGWGYRGGWGQGGYGGGHKGVPPVIEERMQEWHRRAHGEPEPAPPTDTKTV
jgi:hypothetical protein